MRAGQMVVSFKPLSLAILQAAFSALIFPNAYHSCHIFKRKKQGHTIDHFTYINKQILHKYPIIFHCLVTV